MKTTVSTKGQIVLPAEIRQEDDISPGQEFEIERIDRGEYRLKRKQRRSNEGLVPSDRSHRDDRRREGAWLRMSYLVDANVMSEPTRPQPSGTVVAWLAANEADLLVDPIILGELRNGILAFPRSRRRTTLEKWFDSVVRTVECLAWDSGVSGRWPRTLSARPSSNSFRSMTRQSGTNPGHGTAQSVSAAC